jgi:hypothetical protein
VTSITEWAVKTCESDFQVTASVETCAHSMLPSSLQKLTNALAGIEAVFARCHGGRVNDEALLEFRRYCWSALLLAHDAECLEQIDRLVHHAKQLYSECDHDRVALLRANISTALGTLRARVERAERYGKRWRDLRAA